MFTRTRDRWAWITCVLVVTVGVGAETAGARTSPDALRCSSSQPAKVELKCGRHVYYHARGVVTWVRSHATRTLESGQTVRVVVVNRRFQRMLRDHLWLMRRGRAWITEARHRLAPRPAAFNTGHESLWLCIHSGEGAWNSDTGNGYYGGLQMTYGWGGVSRADLLSPEAQMALAEGQYAASGYSRSWLLGQWPNTSPPCLGFA